MYEATNALLQIALSVGSEKIGLRAQAQAVPAVATAPPIAAARVATNGDTCRWRHFSLTIAVVAMG